MNHLLIFSDDDSSFDVSELRSVLESMGCSHFREGTLIESVLECEYGRLAESTIIRLADDFKTVSMSNVSDAALHAALEMQSHLNKPLRAVDTAYSFDISLRSVGSLDEIRDAANRENPE